jgi:hypothetical protein
LQQKAHTDFELLKKKIVETMQQSFPGISSSISEWKGQDIVNFQEELLLRVNAHISEKWSSIHLITGTIRSNGHLKDSTRRRPLD